ncbi:MAG: hypothetical protein JEZ06_24055 [Anaerolineaceae bacterium]|nr:hypothetical protein [Anaerolineaceae bacterium]
MKNEKSKKYAHYWQFGIILLGAVCAVGVFIISSNLYYEIGFPLDDAWIHQTYARNISMHGEWSYTIGKPTGGSTSPLFTALIAIGNLLSVNMFTWIFILGALSLALIGFFGELINREGFPKKKRRIPIIGLFLVFEWHLIWGAVSGMETALYCVLILAVFYFSYKLPDKLFLVGILMGITIWVRPDGLTLIGPVLLIIILGKKLNKELIRSIIGLLIPIIGFFILYGLFNWRFNGALFPNTLFAKQAEYAILLEKPLLERYLSLFQLPLIGAGFIILPGFIFAIFQTFKSKNWELFSFSIWFMGYLLVYALKLPVIYQHGRYIIPAMPVYFLIGLWGLNQIELENKKIRYILSKVCVISIVLVNLLFLAKGAKAYAEDVAFIQTEMVQMGKWVGEYIDPEEIIAVHDIGAIGYFTENEIVDLAGLISPEVIPFIRDEVQLRGFMDNKRVNYFITFPGWYPKLVENKTILYITGSIYSKKMGEGNMTIYEWE